MTVTGVLTPTSAEAQQGARVEYRLEDDGCLAPAALEAGVEERLGRAVFTDGEVALELRLAVTGAGQSLRAVLEVFERERALGVREVVGDCDALRRALPIVIALAVNLGERRIELREPSGTPDAGPAPPPAPPNAADPEPPAPAVRAIPPELPAEGDAPSSFEWGLRAEGTVELGVLPTPSAGGRVTLRLSPIDSLAIELRGAALVPGRHGLGDRAIVAWGIGGGASGCGVVALHEHLELDLCAGADLLAVHARGDGFVEEREAWVPLFVVHGGARLSLLTLRPLVLALGGGIGAPLIAPEFQVQRAETVGLSRSGPVSGFLGLSLEVRSR